MSFSSETSGNGMQRLQQPARYHETNASGGAAAGLGSSSNYAPPKGGYSWSHGNAGEEDKENTPRNVQQRYTWESTERSFQDEDDDPVYVGECNSSIPLGASAEEWDNLIADSEDVRCMGSEVKKTGRTKELEALMATSEDIVSRYSPPASDGGEWSSEEGGDADGEDSDTSGVQQHREHESHVSIPVETTPRHSFVRRDRMSGDERLSGTRYVFLQKVPAEGTPYVRWPQQVLRRVCGHRRIKNMSRCKDNARMADLLERLDAANNGNSSYLDDCINIKGNTPSSGPKTTNSGVISASCPTAKAINIPDGAKAKYLQRVTDGGTLASGYKLPFNGQLFDVDDIRAAIKRDRNAQGLVTPDIRPDGGVQSPPPGRGEEVMPIRLSDTYRRPHGDTGKGRVTTPSPSSEHRCKGKGKGRRLEEGTGPPPNSSNAGICAGVHREMKTKHCAPRLITLIVNRYRDRFMSLSETRASRGALDAGAIREKNDIWQAIRKDFVNPEAEMGGQLSNNLMFEHIDVNVVAQPNISAHKLRKMWKKIVSKWNDVKAKCRSGDTEPLTDMCEDGDTDTQYMSEALAREPQLLKFCWAELPEGQGREEGEVEVDREGGGPGDAQRRKERALTCKERTESLGAVREKAQLEKEAIVKSTAAMESACSMLAPHVESVMTSFLSPQNGGEAVPKVSEEHTKRMNDIEFENAKRDKALADEKARAELAKVKLEVFEELLKKYERVEKELKDAEEGGRSPFVIAMLQEMQKNLKSQITEHHK